MRENVPYTSVDVCSVTDVILFDLDVVGRKKSFEVVTSTDDRDGLIPVNPIHGMLSLSPLSFVSG